MNKIYLAGGFYSGWQDHVIDAVPGPIYLDPRQHGLTDPRDYTRWDLEAIEECDTMFAIFEESNPGGYALCLEIGYAKGLGKTVIFVDERLNDPKASRYMAMVHCSSDFVFPSLEDGVSFFREFVMSQGEE